jgi:hypothetical protein
VALARSAVLMIETVSWDPASLNVVAVIQRLGVTYVLPPSSNLKTVMFTFFIPAKRIA